MRLLLLIFILSWSVMAQSSGFVHRYLEVAGQTVVFDLKAGAKAGWATNGTAVSKVPLQSASEVFWIKAIGNSLVFPNGAIGTVKLFNVRGRMAAGPIAVREGLAAMPQGLTNGIYIARFEASGVSSKTAKMVVAR